MQILSGAPPAWDVSENGHAAPELYSRFADIWVFDKKNTQTTLSSVGQRRSVIEELHVSGWVQRPTSAGYKTDYNAYNQTGPGPSEDPYLPLSATQSFSAVWYGYRTAGIRNVLWALGTGSISASMAKLQWWNDNKLYFNAKTNESGRAISAAQSGTGPHCVIATYNGTNPTLYLDGVSIATGSHTTGNSASGKFNIRKYTENPNPETFLLATSSHILSLDEIERISADPWLLVRQEESPKWAFASAAAGGGGTLSASLSTGISASIEAKAAAAATLAAELSSGLDAAIASGAAAVPATLAAALSSGVSASIEAKAAAAATLGAELGGGLGAAIISDGAAATATISAALSSGVGASIEAKAAAAVTLGAELGGGLGAAIAGGAAAVPATLAAELGGGLLAALEGKSAGTLTVSASLGSGISASISVSTAQTLAAQDGVFPVFEADIKTILDQDGSTISVTTTTGTTQLRAFWEGISLSGGVQVGPFLLTAKADLPASLKTPGLPRSPSTVVYDGDTYDINYLEPDGHGVVRLVVTPQA